MAGDVVFLHEANQVGDGDAAVSAAGDSVAVEELFVEPLADGPACYVTDFGHLACCQDFVALCHSFSFHSIRRDISQPT